MEVVYSRDMHWVQLLLLTLINLFSSNTWIWYVFFQTIFKRYALGSFTFLSTTEKAGVLITTYPLTRFSALKPIRLLLIAFLLTASSHLVIVRCLNVSSRDKW